MKKSYIAVFSLCVFLGATACSGKDAESGITSNPSQTARQSQETSGSQTSAPANAVPGLKSITVQSKADWMEFDITEVDQFEKNGKHYLMISPQFTLSPGTPDGLHAMQEYHVWHDDTNDFEFIPAYEFAGEVAAANKTYGPGNAFRTINYTASDKDQLLGSWLGCEVKAGCKQVTVTFRYDTEDTPYQFTEFCKVTLVLE